MLIVGTVLWAAPGPAAEDPRQALFTIRGQAVDATADDAASAREAALAQGQETALLRLYQRLVPSDELGRLPKLPQPAITDLVQDYSIDEEKTSDVRYLASVTYRFKADAVRKILKESGVQFAETASKPLVVLPVFGGRTGDVIWQDPNPWREIWQARPEEAGLVPLIVPLGDLEDVQAISADQALAPDRAAMTAFASRYGAGDALVVRAVPETSADGDFSAVRVSVARYGGELDAASFNVVAEASVGETSDDVYGRAADEVSLRLQEDWKSRNLIRSGGANWVSASVPVSGLAEWIEVRRRLGGVPIVRSAEVQSLSRTEARLTLVFEGKLDQLAIALNQSDLQLRRGPTEWEIGLGASTVMPDFAPEELNPPSVPSTGPDAGTGALTSEDPGQGWNPQPFLSPYVPRPIAGRRSTEPLSTEPLGTEPLGAGPQPVSTTPADRTYIVRPPPEQPPANQPATQPSSQPPPDPQPVAETPNVAIEDESTGLRTFDSLNSIPSALDTISPLPEHKTE